METTSLSLLQRVRNPLDREAWERLVELYTPFLYAWGRQAGLADADAADLVQEVLLVLAQKLPEFDYDPSKSFRGWLKTVTVNRARNLQRAASKRPAVGARSDVAGSLESQPEIDLFAEDEYRGYLVARLLDLVRGEFSEQVWRAFEMQALEEIRPGLVATELGISVNRVYLAKSRVLQRLRSEAAQLLE